MLSHRPTCTHHGLPTPVSCSNSKTEWPTPPKCLNKKRHIQSSITIIYMVSLCFQRKPPSPPKAPTLPRHPQRLSFSVLLVAPPLRLTEFRCPMVSSAPPNSLLVLPEFELAFVCTNSKLLVELSRFANSVKLSLDAGAASPFNILCIQITCL